MQNERARVEPTTWIKVLLNNLLVFCHRKNNTAYHFITGQCNNFKNVEENNFSSPVILNIYTDIITL